MWKRSVWFWKQNNFLCFPVLGVEFNRKIQYCGTVWYHILLHSFEIKWWGIRFVLVPVAEQYTGYCTYVLVIWKHEILHTNISQDNTGKYWYAIMVSIFGIVKILSVKRSTWYAWYRCQHPNQIKRAVKGTDPIFEV